MTADIETRLLNWSRWCRSSTRGPAADSITGLICERMRKARCGNVYSGLEPYDPIDEKDALRLERAMRLLQPKHFLLLKKHYVKRQPTHITCRELRIRVRPNEYYDEALLDAHSAIAVLLGKLDYAQQERYASGNNLISVDTDETSLPDGRRSCL